MPNAFASLAFLSSLVACHAQNTRIIWPESKQQDTHKSQTHANSQTQENYKVHLDEDGIEVLEVYGGPQDQSALSGTASSPVVTQKDTQEDKARQPLPNEDDEAEEMDDLIHRMTKFRERTEKAQSSKSEEAIYARFFAGLDDDEDEEEGGSKTLKLSGNAIIELLQTGKLPSRLEDLFETSDPGPGSEMPVDVDGPVPKKEHVRKDPPAVITSYQDHADAALGKEHGNPIVLLSRFNFHNNVMTRRDDEVGNWIIRFCHDWYSPCERMLPAYKTMARDVEKQLNQNSMKTVVRFAEIDCSTDKPLCNDQGAESFPKLIHYHRGQQMSAWEGASGKERDVKEMNEWMASQSKKILEQTSQTVAGTVTAKDKIKSLLCATGDLSWIFSVSMMIAAFFWHIWLVRDRADVDAKAGGSTTRKDAEKDAQPPYECSKHVEVLGPSGLGSMLPEEWVSTQSARDLIDL
eukprot:gnl/MRDRNA2_/MRDRNA2_105742_c0_seq1.p1 gnl/MRDRNA2_/MRDRNA2_105742_c0~~gnl/MRDRNA2_/MRDRNA2_105742_c0_seq1.p1  ORF type:complete len:463 (-),score=96.65 gnl/MRDRNA2_/MRDRNA2_105742_c0_seq1:75-1463(-)